MKLSIIILVAFIIGTVTGFSSILPERFIPVNITDITLYFLIFAVGFMVGANSRIWNYLKKKNLRILMVPLLTVVGTLLGGLLISPFISGHDLFEVLSVCSGFGYYSLSSVLITGIKGELLGITALMSNLFRELFTLLFAPVMVRVFGKIAPIASGGATTMDVTLPVIYKFSGEEYSIIAIVSGFVLTLLVPIMVPAFLSFSCR
ncbi:MAG: hypothetical protein DRP54_00945 [Spirochaetes bacterium]|nr:MAG: hypothetical protein DRP54_00945 [Spirochaetota bacterium]